MAHFKHIFHFKKGLLLVLQTLFILHNNVVKMRGIKTYKFPHSALVRLSNLSLKLLLSFALKILFKIGRSHSASVYFHK